MQNLLDEKLLDEVKKVKIKKMEDDIKGLSVGMNLCPFCKYESRKNRKGSAKVFPDGTFKCFSCGTWRKIK